MNKSLWLKIIAVSGFFTVALGAIAAHALESLLTAQRMQTLSAAVEYQSFHTLALLGIVCVPKDLLQLRWKIYAARCFLLGMVLFCGSLYLLVATGIKAFAMITPFGGVAFLIAWVMLFVATLRGQ
jgi:uncharacterized membrane protein YgdD (TMEM256/DUF423 family)